MIIRMTCGLNNFIQEHSLFNIYLILCSRGTVININVSLVGFFNLFLLLLLQKPTKGSKAKAAFAQKQLFL